VSLLKSGGKTFKKSMPSRTGQDLDKKLKKSLKKATFLKKIQSNNKKST
jgi:hypothetical protein